MSLPAMSVIQTVSQLTAALKFLVEREYRFIAVRGEISNLRVPTSGHHYFTLKDVGAQLRGVLLKPQARYLAAPLRDGQQVVCRGRVTIYEPRGDYQLLVDSVEADGEGELRRRFEMVKAKLAAEGLFAPERKRPIPALPEKIVIITSVSGAALHDFLTIWRKRQSNARIAIYPSAVQGKAAVMELATALDRVNAEIGGDVIVLCRGGGSLEDLSAFNEEIVARAIVRSRIPVVTGVGHEIDSTIADFCADRRAPTPTGAAEVILADCGLLRRQIARRRQTLAAHMSAIIERGQLRWRHASRFAQAGLVQAGLAQVSPLSPENYLRQAALKLALAEERLTRAMSGWHNQASQHVASLDGRLRHCSPQEKLRQQEQSFAHLNGRLSWLMQVFPRDLAGKLAHFSGLLHSHSPLATLERGYAIVRNRLGGQVIRDSRQAEVGDEVEILLAHGQLEARLTGRQDDPA
ncbi:MAG: exodeoxyribonuclease VII large subunit [Desulfobulbaceae bacterium]|jgi:exodeoxyribonuclease VII large subunit|nr:exodeoxyribonuclease VII large subunit [Desulfobulbaceae bacterium]